MQLFFTSPGHRLGAGLPFFIDGAGRTYPAVNTWLRHLHSEKGAVNSLLTLDAYAGAMGRYLRFLQTIGVPWNRADDKHLKTFRERREAGAERLPGAAGPKKDVPSQRTVHRDLLVIGQFYRWAERAGFLEHCPITFRSEFVHIPGHGSGKAGRMVTREVPTAARKHPGHGKRSAHQDEKFATDAAVSALLGGLRKLKHRLVAELMFLSGMRRAEVAALKVKVLALAKIVGDQARWRILGKGGKSRVVEVPIGLHGEVAGFIRWQNNKRRGRAGFPSEYVFPNPTGGPLGPGSINRTFTRTCGRVGMLLAVRPHALRHAFARAFLMRCWERKIPYGLEMLSRLLGHANTGFTMETYGHLDTHIRAAIRAEAQPKVTRPPGAAGTSSTAF